MFSATHWLNHYLVYRAVCFANTYLYAICLSIVSFLGHPICQHDVLDGATSKEEEDSRKPLVDIFVNLIQNNGLGPSIAAFRDAQQIVVKRECPPQEILHDRQDPVSFVPNNIPRRVPPKQHAKPSW